MSFRRFRYFVAVAERESFGRAAADLNIAQSALSRHIAALEETVGAKLLDRSQRGTHLTPVGRVLLEDARRLLSQVDATYTHARRAAAGSAGQLNVALIKLAILNPPITSVLARFVADHPGIDLRLTEIPSINQLTALRARKIDAGIMIETGTMLAEFDRLRVLSDSFALALPADHPLAERESLRIDDLRDLPFVVLTLNRYWMLQSKVLAACYAHAFEPRIVLEVEDVFLQSALIASGAGVGFVNASIRNALPAGLVVRPIEDIGLALNVEMVWLRDNPDPLLRAFVEGMRASLAPPEADALPPLP